MSSEREKFNWKAKYVLNIQTCYKWILQNTFSVFLHLLTVAKYGRELGQYMILIRNLICIPFLIQIKLNFCMLCYFYLHLSEDCLKLSHMRYSKKLWSYCQLCGWDWKWIYLQFKFWERKMPGTNSQNMLTVKKNCDHICLVANRLVYEQHILVLALCDVSSKSRRLTVLRL